MVNEEKLDEKNYTFYISKNVKQTLENIYNKEVIKEGFNENMYIFGFYDCWSYNRVLSRFKKALKEANLEDKKLHSLRHGYVYFLANNGLSMQELASALGDNL